MSAGLDYPGVGPEHSFWKDEGRVEYTSVTDDASLAAFRDLCRLEGIIPALESSHAVAFAKRHIGEDAAENSIILINLSGRGDKDIDSVRKALEP